MYAVNCATCHGIEGAGRELADFPTIGLDGDVLSATRRGVAATRQFSQGMPPFAQVNGGPLSESDIENIMAYVRTWEHPTALQIASENAPGGAAMLVLLLGLGALTLVGGMVFLRRDDGSNLNA